MEVKVTTGSTQATPQEIAAREATPAEIAARVGALDERGRRMEERQTRMEDTLAQNTAATNKILDLILTFERGMRVLGWFGAGAKWIAAIGAGVATIYAALHWPPK